VHEAILIDNFADNSQQPTPVAPEDGKARPG
jgi:hypothetical protein